MANKANITIKLNDISIDYLTFGKGKKHLVIIPGVGDALINNKNFTNFYKNKYKAFKDQYKIYIISRRNNMPANFTTADMAQDIIKLLEHLNINNIDLIGISQGGMIAQTVAIKKPDLVNKLVLMVTTPCTNSTISYSVSNWIKMIDAKEYKLLLKDMALKTYVGRNTKRYLKAFELYSKILNKKAYDKFYIMLKACLKHNTLKDLNKITASTYIIGAKLDQVVGYEGSILLHQGIKNAKIKLYEDYSHGVYNEVKDFNKDVLTFLRGK